MTLIVDNTTPRSQALRHRAALRSDTVLRRVQRWIFAFGPGWVRAATVKYGHQRHRWSSVVQRNRRPPVVQLIELR
jgi:hypothetical protein